MKSLLIYLSNKVQALIDKDYFPKSQTIYISKSLKIGIFFSRSISANGHIRILENVYLRDFCNILVFSNAILYIKNNVFFNNYCSINCLGEIEIGENTIFGEGVKMYDHNHLYKFEEKILKVSTNEYKIGYIKIGSNCWIGSNVVILMNVEIGDNVIIGANCLILKSIPSNSIVKASSIIEVKGGDGN